MRDFYSDEGDINLETVDKADKFTDWMYSEIKPFLKGNILEVGSGIGTYSRKIVRDFKKNIILSDIDSGYVKSLSKKFKSEKVSVVKLDLTKKADFKKIKGKFNSAFALNVVEHVEDDLAALRNIYDALAPGGVFVVLVPAHKFLFNCIDENLDHYRRYTPKYTRELVSKTDFKIKKMFYFNFLAMLGWYVNGNILKKPLIDEGAMSLFNKLVPFLKIFEKYLLRKKMGISLVFVLQK